MQSLSKSIGYSVSSAAMIAVIISNLSACDRGLKIDRLNLPENILEDATAAFFEADRSGVIKDYAEVDAGELVSTEKFEITENTDADAIMDGITGKKSRLFIQLPTNDARRDHILRSIAAASIREDIRNNDKWEISVLNTKAIKSTIVNFRFDDHDAKKYFLTVAKQLNQQTDDNDIIVVNIDDFSYGLTAEEFFNALSKPHIVVLSDKGIDTEKIFADKSKSEEFLSKGLNPGHVYKLASMRLQRSRNVTDKTEQDKIALIIAKVVTALEPSGNLGSLGKFFTLIDPIVDGGKKATDLETTILKSLAAFFQANYQYLFELHLENKTLSEIHDRVTKNAQAFSEQAQKTDKILEDVEELVQSGITTLGAGIKDVDTNVTNLGERIATDFRKTRSDIDDVRNYSLPGMQRDLVENADRNRDDIIAITKQSVDRSITQIKNDTKNRHEETQRTVSKNLRSAIDVAQENIAERAREHATGLTQTFFDLVRDLAKKFHAEGLIATSKAVKDVNDHTARLLFRAIDVIQEHTSTTSEKTNAEVQRSLDEIKSFGRTLSARTVANVTQNVSDRIARSQAEINRSMVNTLSESEAILTRALTTESDDIKERIAQAIKRILADSTAGLLSLGKGINQNTSESIKRAENLLMDALAKAENEIKSRITDEHSSTQAAVIAARREVNRSASSILSNTTRQHASTLAMLTKSLQDTVGDAQTILERTINQQTQEVQEVILNALTKSLMATTALGAGINSHTTGTVKQMQFVLTDVLAQTESMIKKQVTEEHQASQESINSNVAKSAKILAATALAQLRQEVLESQRRVNASTAATIGEAQANIDRVVNQQSDDVKDAILAAIKRNIAATSSITAGITTGINVHTADMAKRTQNILVEALVQVEAELKKRLADEQQGSQDFISGNITKSITRSAADVINQIKYEVSQSQRRVNANTSAIVAETQAIIDRVVTQQADEVKDVILATLKRNVAATSSITAGITSGINSNTADTAKRTQNILADALTQTEAELTKRLADEHRVSQDNITSNIAKDIPRLGAAVMSQIRQQILESQRRVNANTEETVNGAQAIIDRVVNQQSEQVKDLILAALNRNIAATSSITEGITRGINIHSTDTARRTQSILANVIAQVEADLKKSLTEELAANSDDLTKNLSQTVMQTATDAIGRLRREILDSQKRISATTTTVVGQLMNEDRDALLKKIGDEAEATRGNNNRELAREGRRLQDQLGTKIAAEHQLTQRQLMRHDIEIIDEILKTKSETMGILEKIEEQIRNSVKQMLIDAERKQSNTKANLRNESLALKQEFTEVKEAIISAVEEGRETLLEATSKLPKTTRQYVARLFGLLSKTMINSSYFFTTIYDFELTKVVAAADNVPLDDIDQGGHARSTRIQRAVAGAHTFYLDPTGKTSQQIQNKARADYGSNTGLAGAPFASPAALSAISGSDRLRQLVDAYREFQSINEAPRPVEPIDFKDAPRRNVQNSDSMEYSDNILAPSQKKFEILEVQED